MAENNRVLNVRFGADTSELSKGVAELRQKLTALNTSLAENKQKISDTNSELKKLQKEEKELSAAMRDGGTDEQKAQLQALKDKIAQTTANLGQLRATEAELRADVRNTTTQLQQQKAGMDSNVKSAGLLDKALGKISATAKTFIGIYGAKKLWELLIGSNAEMEQYQTSFEVMLGDAEKAKKMIEDLRVFAAKTPLLMKDTISTGTLLMNYGVSDNDLISTMTKLGDLASGNTEKLNRISLAYGQMLAKGKVTGEELRQMAEAGVPLQAALTKSIGVTGEELSKMISAGKVGIDDLNKAIDSLTTGNGKFAGMMDKQAQTMNGMLSTLKDNATEFFRKVGEGAFGEVEDELAELMDKLDEWEEDGTLDKIAENIGVTVEALVKALELGVEGVAKFGKEITSVLAGAAAAKAVSKLHEFVDGFKQVGNSAGNANATLSKSQKVWNGVQVGASALAVVITALGLKISEINESSNEYNNTLKTLEKNTQSTIANAEAENKMLENKVKRYDELRTAAELTASEQNELRSVAAELQEVFGNDVTVLDKVTGRYNDLSAAVENYTQKMLEAAKRDAAYETLKTLYAEESRLENEYPELTKNFTSDDFAFMQSYDPNNFWLGDLPASVLDYADLNIPEMLGKADSGDWLAAAKNRSDLADVRRRIKEQEELYGDLAEAIKSTSDAADEASDKITQNADDMGNLSESTDEAASAVEELNETLDSLSAAYKEQQENGQLSYQTIMQLIDAGYAQCLQIDNETGAVKLNAEAYRDLAKAKIEARMAELNTDTIRNEYYEKINAAGAKGDRAEVERLREELKSKITSAPAEAAALQQILDNLDGYMSGGSSYNPYAKEKETKTSTKKKTEEAEDSIEKLNSMMDELSAAYKEQQENEQLSYKTIMDLKDAGYAQCLQIDEETGAVNLNIEAYRKLAKAKIEARMAEINKDGKNTSAAKTELAALQQMLDNLDGYMSGGSSYNPYAKDTKKEAEQYTKAYDAYKTEADKKLALIKDELAAKKELRDKTIEYLDDEIKKRKELNEDNDMQEQIDKVKAQLEYAQMDEFSRGQLEKELKSLEEEQEEMLWQRQIQKQKDEANAAYEEAEANAAKAQEQINEAVNTVKQIMDNLANGITNISNIINNNTNTVNTTQNIQLASQYLTMAQITKAVKDALIGAIITR